MFEPEVCRTVLKEVLVTLLGIFGVPHSHLASPAMIQRPGSCAPLPLFFTPLGETLAYKVWLQNKAEPSLHSGYSEARKSTVLVVKCPNL